MARNECDSCGVTAFDLPDGVDPDLIFESDGKGHVYCQGCASIAAVASVPRIHTDDNGRHTDDAGREYEAVEVGGETDYREKGDPS